LYKKDTNSNLKVNLLKKLKLI